MKVTYALLVSSLSLACSPPAAGDGAAPVDADESTRDALAAFGPNAAGKVKLGALIFNDKSLSEPPGQACASCHDPARAFADPRGTATSEGAVAGRFGARNAPSVAYASFTPALSPSGEETGYAGGLFLDGRAPTLQDQATSPLFNPLEMNNRDAAAVRAKLEKASYAAKFRAAYGAASLDDPDAAVAAMADAVAAFETSGIKGRFTSKFDAYLAGDAELTGQELRGLALFEDPKTGPCANGAPPCGCAQCHVDRPGPDGSPPLFTDFGYDNIGVPKNVDNPFYALPPDLNPGGPDFVDNGLGVFVHNPRQFGAFKAPSLRNVALTAPYGHNGYFVDLKSVVHFYNTRDVRGEWPPPEQGATTNTAGLGNLGLTDQEEDDLVAFLSTLTDGYCPF
jgi:cytochrome c peroxidase